MLEWLEFELKTLEEVGGTAIITQHVPYSHDCTEAIGRRLIAILDRFQTVVRVNFASHIHLNNIEVLKSPTTQAPFGIQFVQGSLTPFNDEKSKNPCIGLAYLSADSLLPIDYETYSFDLQDANEHNFANWQRTGDLRKDFNL